MHTPDPHRIPKAKWAVRVIGLITESEQVCNALFEFFERVSFRFFLLIAFVLALIRLLRH
jgi:hypothetical protein